MTDIIEKTTTVSSEGSDPVVMPSVVPSKDPTVVKQVEVKATSTQTARNMIYFVFGALEVLLAFRLVLKLLGASAGSAFVSLIYTLSGIFIYPFEGIFRRAYTQGVETTSVLEPATLVALLVYAVLAWGIVTFAQLISGKQETL